MMVATMFEGPFAFLNIFSKKLKIIVFLKIVKGEFEVEPDKTAYAPAFSKFAQFGSMPLTYYGTGAPLLEAIKHHALDKHNSKYKILSRYIL